MPKHRTGPTHADAKRTAEIIGLAALFACAALAQPGPPFQEGNVYNRAVYLVGNDKVEVAVVKQGGSMLRLRIMGDA